MTYALILAFIIPVSYALDGRCPLAENIAPLCLCKDLGDGPMMLCHNVLNAEDLIAPIRETEKHDMFSLSLHDSSLQYIPSRTFLNTNYKKILLVGTQLISLAEYDLAFEGLEETLEEYRVMETHYSAQWSWSQLRNLKKIQLINVDWVSLGSVDEPFPPLKSLTALGLTRCDISFMVEDAFQGLDNLRILYLKNNDISDITRSMFPNLASELVILDLSGNQLSSLPGGIFEGMPSLTDLNLGDNKFVTLKEAAFRHVLGYLQSLSLKGNTIRCDCRMRWIIDVKIPREFYVECAQPENLKGMSPKYLSAKDLRC